MRMALPIDLILDAWVGGASMRQIVDTHLVEFTRRRGIKPLPESVARIIWKARKAGDPRAVLRNP